MSDDAAILTRHLGGGRGLRGLALPLIIALWCLVLGTSAQEIARGADAASLAIAARLVAEGRADALYAQAPGSLAVEDPDWRRHAAALGYDWRLYPYLYPPVVAVVAAPAAEAGLAAVKAGLIALTLGCMALAVLIAARAYAPTLLRPTAFLAVLAVLGLSWPMASQLVALNLQPLVILAIVVAIAAAQSGRPALAGSALAVAAAIKLTPAVLVLYWLFTRRFAASLWFVAAGAALIAVGLVLGGLEAHLDWVQRLGEMSRGVVPIPANGSLAALLHALSFGYASAGEALPIRPLPGWIAGATAMAGIAGALACLMKARRFSGRPAADAAGQYSLMLVAVLAAPMAWSHYFLLLAPAAIVWLGLAGVTSRTSLVGAGLAIALSQPVALALAGAAERGWPALAGAIAPTAAVAVIFLLLAARRGVLRTPIPG